jgi:hypothetical protein
VAASSQYGQGGQSAPRPKRLGGGGAKARTPLQARRFQILRDVAESRKSSGRVSSQESTSWPERGYPISQSGVNPVSSPFNPSVSPPSLGTPPAQRRERAGGNLGAIRKAAGTAATVAGIAFPEAGVATKVGLYAAGKIAGGGNSSSGGPPSLGGGTPPAIPPPAGGGHVLGRQWGGGGGLAGFLHGGVNKAAGIYHDIQVYKAPGGYGFLHAIRRATEPEGEYPLGEGKMEEIAIEKGIAAGERDKSFGGFYK